MRSEDKMAADLQMATYCSITTILLFYASHHCWGDRHVPPRQLSFSLRWGLENYLPRLAFTMVLSLPLNLGWQAQAIIPQLVLEFSVQWDQSFLTPGPNHLNPLTYFGESSQESWGDSYLGAGTLFSFYSDNPAQFLINMWSPPFFKLSFRAIIL
jgi:hypothetical protein